MWACDGLTGHLFAAFGTENHRHIKILCFDNYMIIYHKNICKGKIVFEIKTTQTGCFLSWQPQIDNIRTEISLYEAEIMETLDLLEEFLNDLKH